jgi:hypothetical protein
MKMTTTTRRRRRRGRRGRKRKRKLCSRYCAPAHAGVIVIPREVLLQRLREADAETTGGAAYGASQLAFQSHGQVDGGGGDVMKMMNSTKKVMFVPFDCIVFSVAIISSFVSFSFCR